MFEQIALVKAGRFVTKSGTAAEAGSGSIDDVVNNADEVLKCKGGEFCVLDWSDYPKGKVPIPNENPRWISDEEYQKAFKLKNAANKAAHSQDSSLDGLQLHEILPVRFGGDPVSMENKVPLTWSEHIKYTKWWKRIQDSIQNAENMFN